MLDLPVLRSPPFHSDKGGKEGRKEGIIGRTGGRGGRPSQTKGAVSVRLPVCLGRWLSVGVDPWRMEGRAGKEREREGEREGKTHNEQFVLGEGAAKSLEIKRLGEIQITSLVAFHRNCRLRTILLDRGRGYFGIGVQERVSPSPKSYFIQQFNRAFEVETEVTLRSDLLIKV